MVIRACHADLDRRYPSARKMYAELAVLINGDSIRRLRLLERRLTAFKRLATVAVIALAVAGALGYPLYRAFQMTQEKRERQIGASVAEGTKALQDGHMTSALGSFIEALRLTEGLQSREQASRLRCSTTLSQCPRLVQMGFAESCVSFLDFSPDGRRLLATLERESVRMLDVDTGEFLPLVFAQGQRPNMAAFSPDARWIVTADLDAKGDQGAAARIWDASSGEEVRALHHPKGLLSARFSPDGVKLATGSKDNAARIWDRQGNLLLVLEGHTDWGWQVSFNRQRRRYHPATGCLDSASRRPEQPAPEQRSNARGLIQSRRQPRGYLLVGRNHKSMGSCRQLARSSAERPFVFARWRSHGLD